MDRCVDVGMNGWVYGWKDAFDRQTVSSHDCYSSSMQKPLKTASAIKDINDAMHPPIHPSSQSPRPPSLHPSMHRIHLPSHPASSTDDPIHPCIFLAAADARLPLCHCGPALPALGDAPPMLKAIHAQPDVPDHRSPQTVFYCTHPPSRACRVLAFLSPQP